MPLLCYLPGDQGEPTRLVVRVEGFDQRKYVRRGGCRADLDGDRVADLTRELNVSAAGSTGALTA